MEVLRFFLVVVSLVAVTPVAVYCLEVIASCWGRRPRQSAGGKALRPRIAVLVPAHDEETGIAATLLSIQAQLRPGDHLVVVADNCQDKTASVASQFKAT